ncbi:MAG: AMP-binding protein [Candidatus Helarchaeota archaeon]|nr:AMP-binding protein [Candidatus Helarchaeota archaeon]
MSKKKFRMRRKTLLREVIQHKAESIGDKVFLTFVKDFDKGIDEKYTYKDIHLLSNRISNGLLNLGLRRGDGIALMENNSPEFLLVFLSSFKIGTYTVLVNTGLKGDGLKYIINHSDAKAVIINHEYLKTILEIKDQLENIKHFIVDLNEAPNDFELPEGMISLQEVMQASDEEIDVEISLEDLSVLMYTAGTTGLPKGVMFWQGRMLGGLNLQTLSAFAKNFVNDDDILFTCLPLFHANALFLTSMLGFFAERPVILAKKFSASRHMNICRKYGVTVFNGLGGMIPILMKQPEKPNDKEHSITRINSAACPKEVWEAFENRFGIPLNEAYGATDGGGFMLTSMGQKQPIGSMGKALIGTNASVLDDDGNHLGPNEVGELVFEWKEKEAAQREVKYYKNVEASKKLIIQDKNGINWFSTGDLVYKDEDDWYYFVDRKKDSIRRRGENIASFSIEKIINQNEKILESAAFGVKSELGEDEVMIAVVLKPGETMTPEELLDFCQGKMAHFMVPRYIDFVSELPKNAVHRILKRELKKQGITKTTYDRDKAGYKLKRN